MRVWELGLPGDECGSCSAKVAGLPAQFISLEKVKRRLIRCEQCASDPRPEHVAPARELHPLRIAVPPGLGLPQRLEFEAPPATEVRDGLALKPEPAQVPTTDLTSLRLQVERAQAKLRTRGRR